MKDDKNKEAMRSAAPGPEDEAFIDAVTSTLDKAEDDLDPEIRSALTRARTKAVYGESKTNRVWLGLPALGAAMAAIFLFAVLPGKEQQAPRQAELIADLELLSAEEDLELYEDLEFYVWLAKEPDHAG